MGQPDHRKLTHVYSHELGRAVMHLGSRRHGADDIETGTRVNLIVWSHNSEWRAENPNRRKDPTYHPEDGPPDVQCLSYTHDRDFSAYKTLPEGKVWNKRPWCPPRSAEYENFPKL